MMDAWVGHHVSCSDRIGFSIERLANARIDGIIRVYGIFSVCDSGARALVAKLIVVICLMCGSFRN